MYREYMIETATRRHHKNGKNAVKYSKRFDIYKKTNEGDLDYECIGTWSKGSYGDTNIHSGPISSAMFFDSMERLGEWLGEDLYNDLITHRLNKPQNRSKKLSAIWSIDLEQDLLNMHGIDINSEFVRLMSEEIQREIDKDIVKKLKEIIYNSKNEENDNNDIIFRNLIREYSKNE